MRQFLENTTGLSIYPLIGMTIFIGFFLLVLLQMALTRRAHYREMAALPLEEVDRTPRIPTSQPANRP